jgi:hypothetical protein
MERYMAVFHQSLSDFPCTVRLGEKIPDWGISRWNCNSGLRFVPLDDEGLTLRGDRQRLLYKGRRRSHRFTILGDTSFEYDCILEREPDSNVISLLMEGAEYYDFFRQPDFVKEPFLKGSYAVYKKETLLGEGTGKLCHIHRPEIIDARGRRCWGELAVVGNELRITVPEKWLGEATYPVIVDPTIGTTTVGSQHQYQQDEDEDFEDLYFEVDIPCNKFLVEEQINGNCTAWFYANEDDSEAGGRPVIYSDKFSQPYLRKSSQESFINLEVDRNNPKGWRSGTFTVNDTIQTGSNIWFGLFSEYMWYPRFDYGGYFWDAYWDEHGILPNIYPFYDGVNHYQKPNGYKLSMYFIYSDAQNYIMTLTQGVSLTDSRKIKAEYKRNTIQSISVNSGISRFETFYRECVMEVHTTMKVDSFPAFVRLITENIRLIMANYESRTLARKCTETIKTYTVIQRIRGFLRNVKEIVTGFEYFQFRLFILRLLTEKIIVTHAFKYWGTFIRGIKENANNKTETKHKGKYYRKQVDKVQSAGIVSRGLFMIIRIVAKVFVRDFVLMRFLKAKQELVIKSCVCREIVLDSKLS